MRKYDDLVFGFIIYGAMFWGIAESQNSQFWMVYLLLVISFGIFHSLAITLLGVRNALASQHSWAVIPAITVCYEYLRHLVTWCYDGSGLTFFLVGQVVPLRLSRSFASVGGIWLLSFVFAVFVHQLWIALLFRKVTLRRRLFRLGLLLVASAVAIITPIVGRPKTEETSAVITVPFKLTQFAKPSVSAFISDVIRQLRNEELTVLGVETTGTLDLARNVIVSNDVEASLWQELSERNNVSVLTGSWITLAGRNDRVNSIVQYRNGEIVGIEPKHRLAPFVESQPLGTESLISKGWIPKSAVRNAAPKADAEEFLRGFPRPQGVQTGVCYDIFFGPAYLNGLDLSHEFMTCSLDETYDDSGIFQWLSMQHSRIRAIEARRSLVRCSLGGITAAFDPMGNEIEPIASRAGMNLYRVPICRETTFYARTGDWIVWLSFIVVGGWMLHGIMQRRVQRREANVA